MALHTAKAKGATSSPGFIGVACDSSESCVYLTHDNNTTKFYPVEHPLQVVIPLLASTALYAEQILWTNITGRSMTLVAAVFRAGTDPSGDCDIDLEHCPSETAPGAGTLLTVTGTWNLDTGADDKNLAMPLAAAANLAIPDGSSILVIVESGATTALANGCITLILRPTHTAVTFVNV